MPSEAPKYWFYSRECARQAEQAETEERRSRLLELSRAWSEAAACEEAHAERALSAALQTE